jgi:peptidylprolyl isomerase
MFVKTLAVLAVCFIAVSAVPSPQTSYLRNLPEQARARSLAVAIFTGAGEKSEKYVDDLIRGMRAAQDGKVVLSEADVYHHLMKYDEARLSHMAEANLLECERHFAELSQNDAFDAIIPNEIYARTVTFGRGPELEPTTESVEIRCRVSRIPATEKNIYLADTFASGLPERYRFIDLVAGMRQGMTGMRPGEVREIHIHPKWAYGSQSSIEPNISLTVMVELIAFGGTVSQLLPEEPLDCSSPEALQDPESYAIAKRDAAFGEGFVVWSHFRQLSEIVDLEATIAELRCLQGSNYVAAESDRNTYGKLQAYLATCSRGCRPAAS